MRTRCHNPGRQRGVALVTALLVVTLATMAAVALATRQHVDVRRTANLLHGEQAYRYAVAAETWAQVILQYDAEDSTYDTLEEDWAMTIAPLPVEGGSVSGRIADLQGRFNINNLYFKVKLAGGGSANDNGEAQEDEQAKTGETAGEDLSEQQEENSEQQGNDGESADLAYFKRLLDVLGLDEALAAALVDWMDDDIDVLVPDGAEDQDYLVLEVPYRTANRPMMSVSELRLVRGFTPEVMAALLPHVTALPKHTPINVNTATPVVLQALNPELTASDVNVILELREDGGFKDINEFLALDAMAGLQADIPVAVSTGWFRVLTDVSVGDGRAVLESLLARDGKDSAIVYRIRSRQWLLPAT